MLLKSLKLKLLQSITEKMTTMTTLLQHLIQLGSGAGTTISSSGYPTLLNHQHWIQLDAGAGTTTSSNGYPTLLQS